MGNIEFELAGDEVDHGDQIARGSIAASLGFGRLNEAVDSQDSHIVTKCVEALGELLAQEAVQDVTAAAERELINEEWIGQDFFGKQLVQGQAAFDEAREIFRNHRNQKTLP